MATTPPQTVATIDGVHLPDLAQLVIDYDLADAAVKEAADHLASIKDQIKTAMVSAAPGYNHMVLTNVPVPLALNVRMVGGLNTDALKSEQPNIWAHYQKPKRPVWYLTRA